MIYALLLIAIGMMTGPVGILVMLSVLLWRILK